jgi:hypothetical protein
VSTKAGELQANDTDGYALEAQPGKSQERPQKARARSPPRKTACPNCVLPQAPVPGGQTLGPAPDNNLKQHFDKDLKTELGRRVLAPYSVRYCGRGHIAACARSLWAAVAAAYIPARCAATLVGGRSL